jgi:hypothetical protein
MFVMLPEADGCVIFPNFSENMYGTICGATVLWIGIPDPTFGFDTDPDPDWYRYQNRKSDPYVDPTPSFYTCWKNKAKLFLLLFTAMPVYNGFLFSSVANVS